eukprot:scaffold61435_cov63-Phaeocystis_antarctica.AAC.4
MRHLARGVRRRIFLPWPPLPLGRGVVRVCEQQGVRGAVEQLRVADPLRASVGILSIGRAEVGGTVGVGAHRHLAGRGRARASQRACRVPAPRPLAAPAQTGGRERRHLRPCTHRPAACRSAGRGERPGGRPG